MTNEDMIKMRELDEAAERAGGYVSNIRVQDIEYDYRKIIKYCEEKGIEPVDMTIREFNTFIIQ